MSYKWPAKLCWSTYERFNLQSYIPICRYVTYLQWQETHHHEAVQTTFIFCSLASDWPQLHPPESHRTYPAPMPLDSPHLFLFRQLPWPFLPSLTQARLYILSAFNICTLQLSVPSGLCPAQRGGPSQTQVQRSHPRPVNQTNSSSPEGSWFSQKLL